MTMSPLPPAETGNRATGWMKGTAAKIFFVMILALLPLAIAATVTNLQFLRASDQDKRELLQTATRQSADRLAADIAAIRTAQGLTANVLASDPDPGNICQRLIALFHSIGGEDGISAILVDRDKKVQCSFGDIRSLQDLYRSTPSLALGVSLSPELKSVIVPSISRNGSTTAIAAYRLPALRRLTSTNRYDPDRLVTLRMGDQQLVIAGEAGQEKEPATRIVASAPVKDLGIELSAAIDDGNTMASSIFSMLMPLALLFSAAFLGWLVVRKMLIKPLIALHREVAAYAPGKVMQAPPSNRLIASEIIALGDAFQEVSEDVAEHEEEMRLALDRQTRLTREVHHRVKNNLQIISSLISLHWRGATDPASANAYLSIQRRVDALAVVQRNHYAEMDGNRGVRARPMMNEIASGLKISAQVQSGCNLDIAVDCDDVSLHQDIAAPMAFMTAELADLIIALEKENKPQLHISLVVLEDSPHRARFTLAAPAFRSSKAAAGADVPVELYERVLVGLARQLQTPLEHDVAAGEYHVIVPVLP
tara:strand:- start:43 stop:1653 length:1611 start_codon:yes stop_codon:yes gene_type:complete